jgi:hypothetical protein
LAEVEERIASIMKTIVRQKDSVAKLRDRRIDITTAESVLATYHKEALWLLAQRERIRQQLEQISEQQAGQQQQKADESKN